MDGPYLAVFFVELFDQIRSLPVPTFRQDGEAGGLIDDEERVVRVDDVHASIVI
jgi:hypothetical protein